MPQPKSGQSLAGRHKREFPTPDHRDVVLSDVLTGNLADYLSLAAGTQTTDFVEQPDHVLLKEVPIDWNAVARIYGKDRTAEQMYNHEVSWLSDSKDHPVFTRDFLVRRSATAPATRLQPMSGIMRANVITAGSGYTKDTVSVTLSGGVGSGGIITAIVSNTGTIIGLVVLACGHYTIPPALTISDSGSGAGATGAIYLQPNNAVLTREQIVRMQESPLDGLYILMRRTYMTLPGPWVPFTRYDDDLGPIQGRRRVVKNLEQTAALTATTKTTYEAFDGSSHVSHEIEESWTTGTNPAFPIQIADFYDNERGAVHQVKQLVADLASVGSQVVAAGVATHIRYDPFNEFLRYKITETWAVPGPIRTSYEQGPGDVLKRITRRQIAAAVPPASDATTVREVVQALSAAISDRTIEDWVASNGSVLSPLIAPWFKTFATIEPEGVEEISWIKVVRNSVIEPVKGSTSIVVGAETTSLATAARRRIPTFPTGITGAGTWEEGMQGYVVDSEVRFIEGSPNRILIVKTRPIPYPHYEFPQQTFQFPALFTYDSSGGNLVIVNGRIPLGTTTLYKSHRTRNVIGCRIRRFSFGQASVVPGSITAIDGSFYLDAPGAGSVYFHQIDKNTIYADLNASATYCSVFDGAVELERFPFSTVTGCSDAAGSPVADGELPVFYRFFEGEREWAGNIFERSYLVLREDGDIVDDAASGIFGPSGAFPCP